MMQPAAAPKRILIIKPSSLGDIVHALPVLAAARRTHPSSHIAWLAGESFAPLLQGHPLLDEVIVFERRRYGRILRQPALMTDFWRFTRALRQQHFDLVLDLQGLFRSGYLCWATGARRRVGFAAARELSWVFYSQRVATPAQALHAVDKNLALARAAGLIVEPVEFPLALTVAELDAARAAVGGAVPRANPFVAVVLGARWESKRWPDAKFAELINTLHAHGTPCVLLGGPDERAHADGIVRQSHVAPRNLVGQTSLRALVATLSLAGLVVALDSGPLHVGAALGRPTLGLFGPTDPRRTGPYGFTSRVVTHPVPCAPCLRRVCPLGHNDCLHKLASSEVVEMVQRMLAEPAATPC